MKEASEKLTIIDSQHILSALLHLQVQVYSPHKTKERERERKETFQKGNH